MYSRKNNKICAENQKDISLEDEYIPVSILKCKEIDLIKCCARCSTQHFKEVTHSIFKAGPDLYITTVVKPVMYDRVVLIFFYLEIPPP